MSTTKNLNLIVVSGEENMTVYDFIQSIAGSGVDSNFEVIDQIIQDIQDTHNNHGHTVADISDFPTSLPANGGNADTVGGRAPETFALSDHDHDTMSGASSVESGTSGFVPAPKAGNETAFLRGDGTWATPDGKNYVAGRGIEITSDNMVNTSAVLSITSGSTDGAINVDGTDVHVYGLGSAAYLSSDSFMGANEYDPDGEISKAGGIAAWISANYENAEVNSY